MKDTVDEEKILAFFKASVQKCYPCGDTFFAEIDKKGANISFGYRNDEPLKFGKGKEFKIPYLLAEAIFKEGEKNV